MLSIRQHINLPNALSLFRLLSFIPAMWLFNTGLYAYSFIIFLLAALSDYLDGVIARQWNQKTDFGAIIDPAADKVLMTSMYMFFMAIGCIHWVVATVVILRDVLIVSGVAFLKLKNIPCKFEPIWASKVNTAIQLVFLGSIYLAHIFASISMLIPVASVMVVASTLYSFFQYYYVFLEYVQGND